MRVESLRQIPRSVWQYVKRRKANLLLLVASFVWVLSYFGTFSPILSPFVYPNLAPHGWHNITPHGNIVLYDFAASTDTPGLLIACGSAWSITWNDTSTWLPGRLHFWRSSDGGATWELLHPPFGDGQECAVSMPTGEPDTAMATVDSASDPSSSSNRATTWVSHDAGISWHLVATASANSDSASSDYGPGSNYRHGLLYGYGVSGGAANFTLAYSADDGATWAPLPSTPSALQQQGWQIASDSSSPVPDYRGDYWWYRAVSLQGQPPMLEHSTDDGRTWTLVGAIGTEPMQSVLLATTPALPDHVCAAHLSGETTHLSLFASADGGKTWQAGAMPARLANTTGETGFSLQIGANGDCYQGYHYHRAQTPAQENDYAFLRLAPRSTVLQVIPLGNYQNVTSERTNYVPAGSGMHARLIINSELPSPGWAAALSGLATETDENQLLWAAAP
jgi:BNR/Asp-box repeat